MKKILIKGALTISTLLLSALPALPSSFSVTLDFGNSVLQNMTTGAKITGYENGTSGSNAPAGNAVLSLGPVGYTNSGGGSGTYGATSLFLTYSASSTDWVLSGTLDGVNSSNLLTFGNTLGTLSSGQANFNASTSLVNINSTLVTALGFSTVTSVGGLSGGGLSSIVSGSQTINGATYNDTIGSVVMNLQLSGTLAATPEPASFLLFGSGLLVAGIAFKVRRPAVRSAA